MSLRTALLLIVLLAIVAFYITFTKQGFVIQNRILYFAKQSKSSSSLSPLALAAENRLNFNIEYDPKYYRIAYPNGDIPDGKGVCTDVVIRAYRKIGIDLQKLVHEDMSEKFIKYPKIWRLTKPDPNIDHRRVPNLMTFFARKNASLPISNNKEIYKPGHIVAWNLGRGTTHIGIVSTRKSKSGTYKIVHNIGAGPALEDVLFKWEIIGHYRFPAALTTIE